MPSAAQLATNFGTRVKPLTNRRGLTPPEGCKAMSLRELASMQRVLWADATNLELPAKERALCASAWQRLEAQRLDTSCTPRPGQYRPELRPTKRSTAITLDTFTEPPKQVRDAQVVATTVPLVSKDGANQATPETDKQHKTEPIE